MLPAYPGGATKGIMMIVVKKSTGFGYPLFGLDLRAPHSTVDLELIQDSTSKLVRRGVAAHVASPNLAGGYNVVDGL